MAFSRTLRQVWVSGGVDLISKSVALSADGEDSVNATIPANTANVEVDVAFPVADLVAIYMVSDVDLLIETNSSSAPDLAINLSADVPFVWFSDSGMNNPFADDVTVMYATNADPSDAATLQIEILKDVTP